eukprot:UN02512
MNMSKDNKGGRVDRDFLRHVIYGRSLILFSIGFS